MKFVLATHNPRQAEGDGGYPLRTGGGSGEPRRRGNLRRRGGDRHHLCGKRHAEGQGHLRGQRAARHRGRLRSLCGRPERRTRRVFRPLRRGGAGRPGAVYPALLQNMRGQTTRAAHFACAIACAFPGGDELTAEGRCDGAIAFAPMGTAGFGYDPVFLVPEKGRTFGQLTAEEKGAISHRGKALQAFSEKLATYLKK